MTKSMSALFSALLISIMILATTAIGSAASTYWSLDVSTPATTQQSSTFNLDYYLAYTDPTDQFTVQLIANGSNVIQTQKAGNNGKFGDSGRFTVKDIPNGTYTYKVTATRTSDSDTKSTATRTVTIAVPSATVVVVNSGSTSSDSSSSSANTSANGTSASNEASTANGSESSEAAIAAVTDSITETSSETATTGVEGEQDQSSSTGRNITIALLTLAVISGLVWFVLSRLNKQEVS